MKKKIKKRFVIILVLFLFLISLFIIYFLISNKLKNTNTENIVIINNTIKIDSLTLKQKLAQMIVVYGDDKNNIELTKLNIGGILLDSQKDEEGYKNLINKYQENSKIKLFVTTDLEGAWNPFSKFHFFPNFSEIKNNKESYDAGLKEGEVLKELGFNLNFAPVAEFSDEIYGGRSFSGTKEEVKEKLANYIKGLQKNVKGTCKHYPGKGMISNLHEEENTQEISKSDLELFQVCLNNNISAIMIGHQIVSGEINSNGKPSSVSLEVINTLENFSGLIISDEINMNGLSNFYYVKTERYAELINAGENVILDFDFNSHSNFILNGLEKSVKEGKISEEKIDETVRKILIAKGYSII